MSMVDEAPRPTSAQTPYDLIGSEVVRQIVDRFYDLMDSDERYAALRAMHADDLEPMRDSLTGFLCAWLGGPRDWFAERPGICMMSAHARMPIGSDTAGQWIDAMRRAIGEAPLAPALGTRMADALSDLARAMVRPTAARA